ncbi:MAG: hypothetical protein Q7K25_09920 [Actinomycetota bacterium]|nr:hypothetical protein [Actinomycetota bacterium]
MIRVLRVGSIAVTTLILGIGLTACGVPIDDQPEQIDVPSLDS